MIEEISNWNYATDLLDYRDPKFDKKYQVADDFDVIYDEFMDGGGTEQTAYMIEAINYLDHKKRFRHAMEWCSGPGFMGFTLLYKNLCEKISFVDQYVPSLQAIQKTLQASGNRYDQRVEIFQDLDSCHKDNTYDLIISNPPWYAHPISGNSLARNRIAVDENWMAHRNFFLKLRHLMAQDGICILLHTQHGSSPLTFQTHLDDGNLKIKSVLKCSDAPHLYFLVIQHA